MGDIINLITPTVAPVVQTLDSAIHQIEIYMSFIQWIALYTSVQQLGPDFSFIQYSQPPQWYQGKSSALQSASSFLCEHGI